MDAEVVWLAPLLILPGIGLLIMSTSTRYSTLHDQIHHWLDGGHDIAVIDQAHLVTRATHFRNALVALYISIFIFVCARSLIGAVLDFMVIAVDVVVFAIAAVGIGAVCPSYQAVNACPVAGSKAPNVQILSRLP